MLPPRPAPPSEPGHFHAPDTSCILLLAVPLLPSQGQGVLPPKQAHYLSHRS